MGSQGTWRKCVIARGSRDACHRATRRDESQGPVPGQEKERPFFLYTDHVQEPGPYTAQGCPAGPEVTECRGPAPVPATRGQRPCAARRNHRPLSLQVHFVAAIDVYEDGEAGLLLCYNCK